MNSLRSDFQGPSSSQQILIKKTENECISLCVCVCVCVCVCMCVGVCMRERERGREKSCGDHSIPFVRGHT